MKEGKGEEERRKKGKGNIIHAHYYDQVQYPKLMESYKIEVLDRSPSATKFERGVCVVRGVKGRRASPKPPITNLLPQKQIG